MTPALVQLTEARQALAHLTVEASIQTQGQQRYEHGLQKYNVTLDRDDLTPLEWIQHFKEEMMDGIRYAERLQRKLEALNVAHVVLDGATPARDFVSTLSEEDCVVLLESSQWALADADCLVEMDYSDESAKGLRARIRAFMGAS
jgi:hypothetical protein